MMIKKLATACILACCSIGGAAQAALHDRGGGLIYDDVLNVTWLQDTNYSATQWANTHGNLGDVNGIMNWGDANNWASDLAYYDSVRNVTWDDWRLPTSLQPDITCDAQSGGFSYGYGCTGSELGHLFYVDLGGVAGQPITSTHNSNFELFVNWQKYWGTGEANYYWTSTYWTGTGGGKAWGFSVAYGTVAGIFIGEEQHAWAVRDGDVAAIPEPSTYAMFLAGLGLVGFVTQRRKLTQIQHQQDRGV